MFALPVTICIVVLAVCLTGLIVIHWPTSHAKYQRLEWDSFEGELGSAGTKRLRFSGER